MITKIISLSSSFTLFQQLRTNFSYRKYLSDHIIKQIQSKPEAYSICSKKIDQLVAGTKQKYFEQANSVGHEILKSKANMIFRIYSLPEVLNNYKEDLCNLVFSQQIRNQSDLDRICNIIIKEVKINKNFKIQQIQKTKRQSENQKKQFLKQIELLKSSSTPISINEISKKLRSMFITIDSKEIYDKLKEINKQIVKNKQKQLIKNSSQPEVKQKGSHQFWDKLENIKPRLLSLQCNDEQIYQQHLKITGNRLRFRFPPEPNGYLHIGHIKSIRINFQTAKRQGGICYLRYDDTNPQTQSHQYIDNILKNVRWLGYEPDYITYASDYFQQMIEFAVQLIKEGHAYVCDSLQIQIERERKEKLSNQYRDRPVQQSLKMFPDLKQGQTLRLKLDPSSKNPTLRDPVIYRIKDQPHPRTGNKFRVYPIYDFAHCICDSLQHIDYSLCSLEFQVRRELYYKILDLLKLYKPIVWEYSRLNVEGSLISKRKIKALIQSNAINSWSDPRLLTIGGLMSRGYKPSMLLSFIDKVNASRSGNQNIVQFSLLQRQMRKQLFKISEKSMMVLKPFQATIQNIGNQIKEIDVALYTDPQKQVVRKLRVGKILFIQQDQQRVFEKGKTIVLKYLGVFEVTQVSENGIKIAKMEKQVKQLKQRGKQYKIIHWVSQADSDKYQVILYSRLLDEQNKVNQNSKTVHQALVPKYITDQKQDVGKYWHMERLGYFKFDQEGNFIRCTTLQ